jgi:hypothetical protein
MALLFWRLSSGPIQLNNLTAVIQNVVSRLPGNVTARISGIELVWNKKRGDLELHATRVALTTSDGASIFTAPVVNITLSVAALTRRVIALSAVELQDVEIHFLRNKDGTLRLARKPAQPSNGQVEASQDLRDPKELISNLVKVLESPADPEFPLSYLKSIKLQGVITAEDRQLGMNFLLNDVSFEFEGIEDGINGDLSVSIDGPPAISGIEIDVSLLAKGNDISADLNLKGVHLQKLSELNDSLAALDGVNLTLDSDISASMTLPDIIHSLELEARSGAGDLLLPDFIANPIKIRSMNLHATADPVNQKLDLKQLELQLGEQTAQGPDISITGSVRKSGDFFAIESDTALEHLMIDELADYWPENIVTGTRRWLTENLKNGKVDKASLELDLDVPAPESNGKIALKKLGGNIGYSDLSVYFFRPMPPATAVSGSGSYDQSGFVLSVNTGEVEGVGIGPGIVKIEGMDIGQITLDVDTKLNGSLPNALRVLESPPFRINETLGFGSTDTGGQVSANFKIALPLKKGLQPGEINYIVVADLKQVSIKNVIDNISLENGDFSLYDTFKQLNITGKTNIEGIPVSVDWSAVLGPDGHRQTSVNVKAPVISASDIQRLGYPVDQYLSGNLGAEVTATVEANGDIAINLSSDLTDAQLSIPPLKWNKERGDRGKADSRISISKDGIWAFKSIDIEAGTLSTSGHAEYSPSKGGMDIRLETLTWDKTALNDVEISHNTGTGTNVSITSGHLDLEPQFGSDDAQAEAPENQKATDFQQSSDSAAESLSIDLHKLEKIYFSEDRFLTDVTAHFEFDQGGWQSIQLSGLTPKVEVSQRLSSFDNKSTPVGNTFNVSFGPLQNNSYPLSIDVDNLGMLFATVLDSQALTGGDLHISGESRDAFGKAPFETDFELNNFIILDAPVFAQVLNFASLSQTLNTLNKEGLIVDSFYGDLSLSGTTLSSQLLRAHSATIGATIGGKLDYVSTDLDLKGRLIPLDKISDFVGKIPVLKHVLTSEDDVGIIALDYSVSGTLGKPKISVKPGSLLTPGALRDIFKPNPDQ